MQRSFLAAIFILVLAMSVQAQAALAILTKPEQLNKLDSQNAGVFERWPSALGYYVNTFGAGLQWQRWFGQLGIQVSAGGTYNPASYFGEFLAYNTQVHVSYMLHDFEYLSWLSGNLHVKTVFGHAGSQSWHYDIRDVPEDTLDLREDTGVAPEKSAFKTAWLFGGGVGVDIVLLEHLSQTFDFMYVASFPDFAVSLSVGTGISFRY
jgi:hypothetical protein